MQNYTILTLKQGYLISDTFANEWVLDLISSKTSKNIQNSKLVGNFRKILLSNEQLKSF